MKQALFLYLLFLSFASFSQTNGSFTLDWKSKKEMSIGDNKIVIPYFSGAAFRFDTTKKKHNITA